MIKREILEDIRKHIKAPEITLLIGPRQAGKTTMIEILRQELENQGSKTLYFNLDIDSDAAYFESQEILLRRIQSEFGNNKGYVFIDEIQRKENAGLFLKGLYDRKLPYKLIVTGSGSIELKEKISESIAGRKRIFEVSTISFREFANYKTNYKYENRLQEYLLSDISMANNLLLEYLNYGGYPRVILANTLEEKYQTIDEIYNSYLIKDITLLLGLSKPDQFTKLVKILSLQIGNLINYSELSNLLDLSEETIKKYLWYLENTFIVDTVKPFYSNKRKEITKSPILYFNDLGLRNYASDNFGKIEFNKDISFVFENLIYHLLSLKTRYTPNQIKFWRTKDGAEVDFIHETAKSSIPYEVKYRSVNKIKSGKSLINFINKYIPEKSYLVGLPDFKEAKNFEKISVTNFIDLL